MAAGTRKQKIRFMLLTETGRYGAEIDAGEVCKRMSQFPRETLLDSLGGLFSELKTAGPKEAQRIGEYICGVVVALSFSESGGEFYKANYCIVDNRPEDEDEGEIRVHGFETFREFEDKLHEVELDRDEVGLKSPPQKPRAAFRLS